MDHYYPSSPQIQLPSSKVENVDEDFEFGAFFFVLRGFLVLLLSSRLSVHDVIRLDSRTRDLDGPTHSL